MRLNDDLIIRMGDVIAWDGVIHPIDTILIPPKHAAGEGYLRSVRDITLEQIIGRLEPHGGLELL